MQISLPFLRRHLRAGLMYHAFVSGVAFLNVPLVAQTATPGTPAKDIRPTYAKLCSGCHGVDARGTQQGPGLSGNPWVRRRSLQSLRNVIRNGVPAAGMPAFDLPAADIDVKRGDVSPMRDKAAAMMEVRPVAPAPTPDASDPAIAGEPSRSDC